MTDGPWTVRDLDKTLIVRPAGAGVYEVSDGRTKKKFDIGTSTIYVGEAALGTATSAATWTIRKVTLSGGLPVTSEWTALRGATWDNRTTETYS